MNTGLCHCLDREFIALDFGNVDAVKNHLALPLTCSFDDCTEPRDCVAKRTDYARGMFIRLRALRARSRNRRAA